MISADSESEAQNDLADIYHGILRDDVTLLKQGLEGHANINMTFKGDSNLQHIGMTPLALAAALNKINALKFLLEHGANINDTFASLKTTALMTASFHGHARIVETLLKNGANVQAIDLQGSTALGYAFGGSRSVEVIELLLASGVNINQKNMLGMNALLLVAGYGDDRLVRMVLDAGADPDSVNDFGHSALHLVIVGKRSQLKKLAQDGAGNKMTLDNFNDLKSAEVALKDWAARNKRVSVDSRKLEKAASLMTNIGSKLQKTLTKLTDESDQEVIKQRVEAVWLHRQEKLLANKRSLKKSGKLESLLMCGGNKKDKGQASSQPYLSVPTRSSKRMNTERDKEVADLKDKFGRILTLIADAGCDVGATEKTFGMTALDMAILLEDVESTGLLVARGADPEHLLKMFALSDLHEAVVTGHKRLVDKLISYDVDLDINHYFSTFNVDSKSQEDDEIAGEFVLSDGVTPLTVAAQVPEEEGHAGKIAKTLLKSRAEVDKMGPGGSTPLMEASRVGNLKMTQMLIAHAADINLPCPRYNDATPIIIAAIFNRVEIAQLLADKLAKLDIETTDGRCALTEAYRNDNLKIVETVLRGSLAQAFSDKGSFTYEMVVKYQRPDQNMTTIIKIIGDEVKRQDEERRTREIAARKKQSMSFLRRVSEPSAIVHQKSFKNSQESQKNVKERNLCGTNNGTDLELTLLEDVPKVQNTDPYKPGASISQLKSDLETLTNSKLDSIKYSFPSSTNSLEAHKNALLDGAASKTEEVKKNVRQMKSNLSEGMTNAQTKYEENVKKPIQNAFNTFGHPKENPLESPYGFHLKNDSLSPKAPGLKKVEQESVEKSYEEDWEDETGFQEHYYPASCIENGEACLMTTPILGRCAQVRHNFAQADSYLRDVVKTGNVRKLSRSVIRTIDDDEEEETDNDKIINRKGVEKRSETDI